MTKLVLGKANYGDKLKGLAERRGDTMPDDNEKLEQFRRRILDHLDSIDDGKEEKAMQKAFSSMLRMAKGGKGLPVGTIREWKGKKFVKVAPGKWRPKYDSETRGAKMAVSAIKRKIATAQDAQTMLQIVLENKDRFSDRHGQPLPFVMELHNYIEGQKTAKGQEKPKKQDKPESVSNKNDTKKKLLDTAAPSMPPETRGNSRETVSEDKLKDPINGHMRFNGEHFTFSDPTRDRTDPDSRHTGGFYDNERGRALLKERIEEIARKGAIFASRKNGETYKPDEAAEALKSGGDIVIIPPEKEVSEESEEEKRQSRSESMRGNKNAYKGGGEEGQRKTRLGLRAQDKGKEARKKEGHAAEEKPILKDNIHTILHGTPEEKEKLQQSFFYMAKTPEFMKDIGLSGDYFSVRFGVVSRHERKDEDHNLTEQNWIDLTEAITKPFAIAKHGEGFRLFTGVKTNGKFIAVGVDVKNIGKGIEVNSVSTVFGKTPPAEGIKDVIYRGKKITPEQAALLEGPNSPSYPPVGAIPSVSPETGEKSSEFAKIQEKYRSAKSVTGDEDEIQVGKEVLSGMWKLVEADTPTASHDETDFHKTPGFPTTDDGATINDRDYGHDREAQEIVMEIGSDYDGRAVSVDNPVIVTKDGIVISGNNRTMSSKIAARKGTDQGYIEALKRKAKKFGFTPEQVEQFKHPRVIFETAENTGYSTDQFAKFNKSSKKAMSPIESAVKVSKTIKTVTVESIAGKMEDFETLGELYADRNAVNEIFNTLQRDAIISAMDRPQYVVDGGITGAGKEFLETVLIGSVINESNIRGLNREGCKSIRQKLVRAITPLIENKGMDGYSISKELNEAVDIAMQVAVQKDKFKSIDDYTSQKSLFGIEDDPVSVEIARRLEGTQKDFAAFMQSMNGGLKYAANGEADIFMGGVESREAILGRMLNLKKAIGNVIDFFRNLRAGKGARFIKKAVPVRGENGATELSQRWMQESIEGIAPYVEGAGISETGTKVVAVDFDGVINSYVSGWKGPSETDAPVLSAAESLKTLFNSGYKVIIFSTRANTREGIETIREYLRKHTENNELADTIEITGQKPIADMYIDDRAIPFNGDWEETLKQIEQFKPWTERDESISDETVNLPDGIYQGKRFAYKVRLDNGVLFSTKIGIRCTERHAAPCKVKIISGKPYRIMRKSLTWSGYPLEGRAKVQGMDISIENKKGSVRSGTDKDGHEWSIKMNFDYGYIRGTVGKDKDHVDCYIGPNPEAETVFIIHQNDPATGEYDEDKVMLGFDREEEARKAYLSQYDRPGFLGGIETMDIETFKDKAFDPESRGKKLRA